MTRFLIGIDLGTTNSALAYIDLQGPKKGTRTPAIRALAIPELVNAGEVKERELLPSFLYMPGPHDLPAGATVVPWDPESPFVVGEFARNHGSRIPGRLVTSAKSWLCHTGVDRSAPLLPWSAPPDVPRISPVEASTHYLRHLVAAWNHLHPKDPLEKQLVVLTVPASFDDMARTLTVEAARKAGLENITLLEEPQAAFYCWLATHSQHEAAKLKPGDHCLVVDVGGGTTDFSLIRAGEHEGELTFLREAVGDHLLLGGDNMDLALAKFVETKLPGTGRLDAAQYGLLTQACRQAKETLLGPNPPASVSVTVMGRGRQVIGGSVHASLSLDDVRRTIVDGFFPIVPAGAEPERGPRTGLHEMGLPYVSDPAITRHLSGFLKRHLSDATRAPEAILFNGGVFTPVSLRDRVAEVVRHWYDAREPGWQPLVLTNPSLDLAVAWGAAHFAWLKHSGGRRIGGGIARSYYLAVANDPAGDGARKTVLCVVPQHLEEGQEVTLEGTELELALGQPVTFPLFTSTVRGRDKPGDVLEVAPAQLLQLPPLHTVLRGGKRSGTKSAIVTLAARCTEIGTLELFCVAKDGNNRWRLEFNVRDILQEPSETKDDGRAMDKAIRDVWPEGPVQEAGALIRATYAETPGAPAPQQLTKSLEDVLEASREKWPTGLCRRLWDFLAEVAERRRLSPGHLSRWFNLVGFCLRPGFGDALDRYRIDQLWKLLHAPRGNKGGMQQAEGGADFWIMWRRVAGGLNTPLQNTLYTRLRPVLLPGKSKVSRPGANEFTEMWRAVASLERIDVKQKEQLGEAVLKSCRRSPTPPYAYFALTRLGARVLLYGPLNVVVHPQVVQNWLEAVLPFQPGHESERLAWCFCLAQLARKSGQRALDIDDSARRAVLNVLQKEQVPHHWIRMVEEVLELDADEQNQMFGEALPIGLRLVRSEE